MNDAKRSSVRSERLMTDGERRLMQNLAGPLFRCRGGWRRGAKKISLQKGRELVAAGAMRRTTSKSGTAMLVPTASFSPPFGRPTDARASVVDPLDGTEARRPWWVDQ